VSLMNLMDLMHLVSLADLMDLMDGRGVIFNTFPGLCRHQLEWDGTD